mmetsp:Transcript_14979/g.46516  ORF Transcript_14979/g.46516 Transcript_14979/m.46516 type:complete len:242 (+) Transcript_14979:681-1406(+)
MNDTVLSALSAVAKLHTTRDAHVGLSRDDLLAITRTGRDLVAHAEAELQRRLRFPSRLAPALVLRFLDVPTIGASLAVSAGWGKTAEAVFQSVAADLGVTSIAEGQQWHDIVREQVSLRWVGATDDPDRCRFLSEFDGMELGTAKVASPDSESGDTYVIGRGIRLRQGCERRWRIKMDKIPGIVDAVGWCLCSSCSSGRRCARAYGIAMGTDSIPMIGFTSPFFPTTLNMTSLEIILSRCA